MANGHEDADLVSPVAKLNIEADKTGPAAGSEKAAAGKPKAAKKKKEVADSWEDEDVSSEEETVVPAPKPMATTTTTTTAPAQVPAPEMTPPASSRQRYRPAPSTGGNPSSPALSADWSRPDPGASDSGPAQRPEKTDVVARRLIAGALGIRVPQTAEQKAYNKSLLEAERKKREKARAEKKQQQEEAERAKKATWGE